MASVYQPPDEAIISTLLQSFPCRERQIRALSTLLCRSSAYAKNLVIYGPKATGKSAITQALLDEVAKLDADDPSVRHAVVSSARCISGRHLFETTLAAVAEALGVEDAPKRCENMAQLAAELSKMLSYHYDTQERFILVFDGIGSQKEAPPTLLPSLARLPEIIPHLTCIFILTSPPPHALQNLTATYLEFPNYEKHEFVKILALEPPPTVPTTTAQDTADLWTRFCGAVHDSLARPASRTLPAFRSGCRALWPRFTAPIQAGTHSAREFSKLLIAARAHFQDESLLNPGIISVVKPARDPSGTSLSSPGPPTTPKGREGPTTDLAALLPTVARLLLVSAYLASHNPARHDTTVFSTHLHTRRRRRGGATSATSTPRRAAKHRKIARKLLGAHSFVLERMMAIFASVRSEWAAGAGAAASSGVPPGGVVDADVGVALATLSSLRLLVRVGVGGDPMDRGARWRINVSWEAVRALGRSLGIEVEDWLVE